VPCRASPIRVDDDSGSAVGATRGQGSTEGKEELAVAEWVAEGSRWRTTGGE
jgi:hypothetical protein